MTVDETNRCGRSAGILGILQTAGCACFMSRTAACRGPAIAVWSWPGVNISRVRTPTIGANLIGWSARPPC